MWLNVILIVAWIPIDDAKEEENEDDCLLLRAHHRVTWTNDFCIHFTRFIHLIFSWAVWDGGCSLLLTCSYVRACQLRSGWFEIFIEKSENPQARAIYDDEKKKKKKKKKKRCRRDDYSRLWWSMTLFACLLREKGKEYPSVCVCVPYWVVWCAVAAAAAEFDCISAHDAIAVTCLPHCFQTICYILRERERVCSKEWISLIKMLTNTWRSIIGPRLVSASTAGALLLPPACCCRGVRNHTFEYHSKVEENTFFLMYLHY